VPSIKVKVEVKVVIFSVGKAGMLEELE